MNIDQDCILCGGLGVAIFRWRIDTSTPNQDDAEEWREEKWACPCTEQPSTPTQTGD